MGLAYYNEHEPYAAAWLRNLIAAGHIAPGVVDERDIRDIRPEELDGFTQCHFFAGLGVWSYALRRAGISDDTPLWTGSCPCQPFSAAGRRGGTADERHLWPHWHWLISQCRPPIVLGEQVASKDGLGWYDLVSNDLEGTGYAVGAVDLCAAGVGVDWQDGQAGEWLRRAIHDCTDPVVRDMLCDFADWAGAGNIGEGGHHIRQRLYFVGLADSGSERHDGIDALLRPENNGRIGAKTIPKASGSGGHLGLADPMHSGRPEWGTGAGNGQTAGLRAVGGVVDSDRSRARTATGSDRQAGPKETRGTRADDGSAIPYGTGCSSGMADSNDPRLEGRLGMSERADKWPIGPDGLAIRPNATDRAGRPVDWLFCRDGKWRATRSGAFPLAHGATARVGRLRAYGNALDAETAVQFCQVVKELIE